MSEDDGYFAARWDYTSASTEAPTFSVKRFGAVLPMSDDLLMDEGLIPDTRPPVHISRRQRFRWWRQRKTDRLRMRVGSWVAGVDLDERDGY